MFKTYLLRNKFQYGSLLVAQIILAFIAFTRHFLTPLQTVFYDKYDGMKNNFTLASFVKEPVGKEGIFKYDIMNYPFGDYVFATDNTPFFSLPFRWFCHYIYDISDYALPVFHFFIISSILFSGLLLFYIFKKLLKNPLLAWLLALILPWVNFQVIRICSGHYNLSLTVLPVLSISLFLIWSKYYKDKKKRLFLLAFLILFSYCCFLIHGYYLAIIPLFLSAMLFFHGVFLLCKKEKGWSSIISAGLIPFLTGLLAMLTLSSTDRYFHLRQSFANGYDWMEQKTIPSLLFSHYPFQHFFFPIFSAKKPDYIERMCYLGNIGLYAVAILFIACVFNSRFRSMIWDIQKDFFKDPVKAGILLAGLLMLSISLGEHYIPIGEGVRFSWPVSTDGTLNTGMGFFVLIGAAGVIYFIIRILLHKEPLFDFRSDDRTRKKNIKNTILFYFLSCIFLFLIFGRYSVQIVNITNPLWFAHKFTRTVEQFRSLVRFAWPFYWCFYVWIMFTVAAVYLRIHKRGKLLIIALIVLLGGSESIDFISEIKRASNNGNVLSKDALEPMAHLKFSFHDYQAILPIPYYNVGCEDYNNTIDDIDDWSRLTYQLSLYSQLPLMSGKMARTPPAFAHLLLDIFIKDRIPAEISRRLNEKPILIAVSRNYLNDSTLNIIPDKAEKPNSNLAYWKGNDFVERHQLVLLDSLGSIYFYKWEWQKNR